MQYIPNYGGMVLGVHGLLGKRRCTMRVPPAVSSRSQPPAKRGMLFQSAQRGPQGGLELLRLMHQQSFVAIGVSYPAAEANELPIFDLPEYAVAFGAGHGGWNARLHMPVSDGELVRRLIARLLIL
jgi:hypothetical protein